MRARAPMAMATGTGQGGEWYTADLGDTEKDELLSEVLDEEMAAGSRAGQRTSAPRMGRQALAVTATTGTERGKDGTFIGTRALLKYEAETRRAANYPAVAGTARPAELVSVTKRREVRSPGTNYCGCFEWEVGMRGVVNPAATSARQLKAKYSALTSGSPSWATRACTPRKRKQSSWPEMPARRTAALTSARPPRSSRA